MWQALLPLIGSVIEKVIPDPQAAADAKLKALELAQKGELAALDAEMKLALGQLEINKFEAQTDKFRGGWRPFIGWVCGTGFAVEFIARPLLPWFAQLAGLHAVDIPQMDTSTLMTLLLGMLGLGGLRTFERINGRIPPGK